MKNYIIKNLGKGFIKPSKVLFGLLILFIFKSNKDLRLYINYRGFNVITKRNKYPIPLINKVFTRVAGYKYFTRLNIIVTFNKLKINPENEDFITFIISLKTFKYKIMPFGLNNSLAFY